MADSLRPPRHRIERRAVLWWVLRVLLTYGLLVVGLAVGAVVWDAGRVWLIPLVVVGGAVLVAHAAIAPPWRFAVHRWETTDDAVHALGGLVRPGVARRTRVADPDGRAARGPRLRSVTPATAAGRGGCTAPDLDREKAVEPARRAAPELLDPVIVDP